MSQALAFLSGMMILLFGTLAWGQTTTQPAGGSQSIVSLIVILGVFAAVFYFMLIRPQRRRQAKHSELMSSLKRGDKVITAGGIYGEIDSIGDNSVVLVLEDGSKIRIAKTSIVDKRAK